mgnify:FL=1
MSLKFLSPLLILVSNLYAQNTFQGVVADRETKQPLSFVNIGVVNQNTGTVSDLDGFFSLKIKASQKEEALRFSMIGYESYTQSVRSFISEFSSGDTLYLNSEVFELSEIVLSEKKWRRKTIGNKTKSKSVSTGFINNELGNEIGVVISVKDSPTVLESFNFNINENQYKPLVFRVNIYSLKNGLPHRSLVYENIIVNSSLRNGMMRIDLRDYNIWVEEDFYIGLEWIQDLGNKSLLFSADRLTGSIVNRQTSQGSWNTVKGLGLGFHVEVKY